MGVLLALVAGAFTPLTNLTVRKSIDVGGSAKAYFVFQMASSFLFAVLLGPVRSGDLAIPLPAALLGSVAGVILSMMLFSMGKAVEKGPPGMTFAILFSATVMPGLLMTLVFGPALGFEYNVWHAIGSSLVLLGLFWGAKGLTEMKEKKIWILFCSLMFTFHLLLLGIYQWRAMLINHPEALTFAQPQEIMSEWFTAFMFLTSALIQFVVYLRAKSQPLRGGEVLYGVAGGVFNMLCTFFLLWAAEQASPLENAVIFPIYAVMGIVLTNMWGQKFYHERVNWWACSLCVLGLVVGTVNWSAVVKAIGL
jgi:drug/metabolite transporter (DMT)-like permease